MKNAFEIKTEGIYLLKAPRRGQAEVAFAQHPLLGTSRHRLYRRREAPMLLPFLEPRTLRFTTARTNSLLAKIENWKYKDSRLALTFAVGQVLKNSHKLFGIASPERM